MKILIQWTLKSPRGWEQYDPRRLQAALAKPEPTADPRAPGNEAVISQSRGWIHSVNVQGVTFNSFDHYHFEELPDSGLRLTAWNDDPNDWTGREYAYVYTFRSAFMDEAEGSAWNVRQSRVIYSRDERRNQLTQDGQLVIQNTEFRPWSEFVPPTGQVFHGIWCPDDLHEEHGGKQSQRGWREWTENVPQEEIVDGKIRPQRPLGRYPKARGTRTYYGIGTGQAITGVVGEYEQIMTTTSQAGGGTALDATVRKNDDEVTHSWATPANEPNSAAWPAGSVGTGYRYRLDCSTCGTNITYGLLASINVDAGFARFNSDCSVLQEGPYDQSEGALATTGQNTVTNTTVTWSAGTATDRCVFFVGGLNANTKDGEILGIDHSSADNWGDGPWAGALQTISPTGIVTAEAVGAHTVAADTAQEVIPSGVVTAEALGSPTLALYVLPTGVTSEEAVGSPALTLYILATGIASEEALGSLTLTLYVSPTGVASEEAIGSFVLDTTVDVAPISITTAEAIGTAVITSTVNVAPSSVTSEEAIGSLNIMVDQTVTLTTGITSAEAIGSHTVSTGVQEILPSGIASAEAVGACSVDTMTRYWVGAVDGTWNDDGNWAFVSAGSGGAGIPTSVDDVYLDGSYTGTAACTCDVAIACASLTVEATYDAKLDFANSAYAHSIGTGGATFAGVGEVDCGDATITCSGNFNNKLQTTWTSSTNPLIMDTDGTSLTIGASNDLFRLTITATGTVTISSASEVGVELSNLTVNDGATLVLDRGITTKYVDKIISGTISVTVGQIWSAWGVLTLNATGHVTGLGGVGFVSGTINNSGGTWDVASATTAWGMTIGAGTYGGAWILQNGSGDVRSVTFGAGTTVFTDDVECRATTGGVDIKLDTNNASIEFQGDLDLTELPGTLTWYKSATGTVTFAGTTIYTDDTAATQNIGDVSIDGTSFTLDSDMECDDFTVEAGASGNVDLANLAYAVTVNGNFTASGTGEVDLGDATITCSGNWDHSLQTTWTHDTSTIILTGTGTTLKGDQTSGYIYNLTVALGASVTSTNDQYVYGLLDVVGEFIVSYRLWLNDSADLKIRSTGTLTIYSHFNFSNTATFSEFNSSGTFDDDGTGLIYINNTITLPPGNYDVDSISMDGASANLTLSSGDYIFGDFDVYNDDSPGSNIFDCSAATSVTFGNFSVYSEPGATSTVDNSGSCDWTVTGTIFDIYDSGLVTWLKGTGTISFAGTTQYRDYATIARNIGDVEIDGNLTLASNMECDDLTYAVSSTGTFTTSGYDLTVTSCDCTNGGSATFNIPTGTTVTCAGDWDIDGIGVMTAYYGLLVLTGASNTVDAKGYTQRLGTIQVSGDYTSAGLLYMDSLIVDSGKSIALNHATECHADITNNGGTISGSSTLKGLKIGGGTITNTGAWTVANTDLQRGYDLNPGTYGGNFKLSHSGTSDWAAGSYIFTGPFEIDAFSGAITSTMTGLAVNVEFQDDFTIGGTYGVTWNAGTGTMSFAGTTTYIDTTAATQNIGDVSIDGTSFLLASDMECDDFTVEIGASGNVDLANLAYAVTVNGNFTADGDGEFDCGDATITCSGNFDNADQGTWTRDASTVALDGVGKVIVGNSSNSFYNLTIAAGASIEHPAASSSVSAYGLLDIAGTFIINEIVFAYADFKLRSTGTLTNNDVLRLQLTWSEYDPAATIDGDGTGNIKILADMTIPAGDYSGLKWFEIPYTNNVTFVGAYIFDEFSAYNNSGSGFTGTLDFSAVTTITLLNSFAIQCVNNTTNINNSGSADWFIGGNFSITVGGTWVINWTTGTGLITFDGTTQYVDQSGENIGDVLIDNTATSFLLASDMECDDFTVEAGGTASIDLADSAYALTVNGNFTASGGGIFDCGDATITCSGNFDNANQGTWTYDVSTVILTGTGKSFAGSSSNDFYNLTIASGAGISFNNDVFIAAYGLCDIVGGLTFTGVSGGGVDLMSSGDFKMRSTGTLTLNGVNSKIRWFDSSTFSEFHVSSTIAGDGDGLFEFRTSVSVPAGDYSDLYKVNLYGPNAFTLQAGTHTYSMFQVDHDGPVGTSTVDLSAITTLNIEFFYLLYDETLNLDNSGSTNWFISGNFTVYDYGVGTINWTTGTGEITFGGTTIYTDDTAATQNIGDVDVDGALTLASDMECDDFTSTSGSLNMGGAYTLQAYGNLDWSSGFGVTPTNGCTVDVDGNFTCNGQTLTAASATWDLAVSGTAVASGTGTVDFCDADPSPGGYTEIDASVGPWTDGGDNNNWDFGALVVLASGIVSAEALGSPAIKIYVEPTSVTSEETLGSHFVSAGLNVLPSAVTSEEAVGSHDLDWPQTITLTTGIATAEALGSPTLVLYVLPTGIATEEALGSPALTIYVLPNGIVTAEALGSLTLTIYVLPTGVTSEEAIGSHDLDWPQTVALTTGIVSEEAVGSHDLDWPQTITLTTGITSEEAIGSILISALAVAPSGVVSVEAVGTPDLDWPQTITLTTGIASAEALGSPSLTIYVLATGIATAEAIGSLTLSHMYYVLPDGIATAEATGSPTLTIYVLPTGIATAEAIGSLTLSHMYYVLPDGITSEEALGALTLTHTDYVLPNGIASEEALGSLVLSHMYYVLPDGIASEEALGSHAITPGAVTILPDGVASVEIIGAHLVSSLAVAPSGIASVEAIGSHDLDWPQTLTLTGVASEEAIGSHDLDWPQTITLTTGIATAEALGSPAISSLVVLPSGIVTAEAIGSHDLDWPQTLTLTGIVSAETLGSPALTIYVLTVGVTTEEALGALTLAIYVLPTGIASAEATGSLAVSAVYSVLPDGIASEEALGALTLTTGPVFVLPTGIATAEAVGSQFVTLAQVIGPTGIASVEALGDHLMTWDQTLIFVGVSSAEAVGSHTLLPGVVVVTLTTGIATAEALGSPALSLYVLPDGVTSEEAIGLSAFTLYVLPTGVTSAEAIGALALSHMYYVAPTGIASAEALGSPQLNLVLHMAGIITEEAIGNHTLVPGGVFVEPTGIATVEAVGEPVLTIYILPAGVATGEAIGTFSLIMGAVTVAPAGIASAEVIGDHQVIGDFGGLFVPTDGIFVGVF